MTDLQKALRALNKAAHDANREAIRTTAHPKLDRQSLNLIARMTDTLVDDNASVISGGK
jgi:hypothetical protein